MFIFFCCTLLVLFEIDRTIALIEQEAPIHQHFEWMILVYGNYDLHIISISVASMTFGKFLPYDVCHGGRCRSPTLRQLGFETRLGTCQRLRANDVDDVAMSLGPTFGCFQK